MKLLVQKVTRASVEVDGMVESRIGAGLVLTLALADGDSADRLHSLAAKVVKLNLWPELTDQDVPWKTNVMDNGYEVLVILQQSLVATFPKLEPSQALAMDTDGAKAIFEAFTKKLQSEYQEEMIVSAPADKVLRVETTGDGPCLFELGWDGAGAPRATTKAAVKSKDGVAAAAELEPEVSSVTRALQEIPVMTKSKATLESCRVFRMFSLKKFRAALSEAMQSETDEFAEALEGAARFFSKKQLEQIMSWTGLTIISASRDEAPQEDDDEGAIEGGEDLGGGALDEQLAQLQEEVVNPEAARKRRLAEAVKKEQESQAKAARIAPDWTGRAAPNTPAANAARQWAASRGNLRQAGPAAAPGHWAPTKGGPKGGKSYGKGAPRPWRSIHGIASLQDSARMHGNSTAGFQHGQLARFSGKETHFMQAKQEEAADGAWDEEEAEAPARRVPEPPRRPKGTPTLAPMTPAPNGEDL